ncbi:MAG: hypothetical protein P8184_09420 [Calditrichia bacterium]
MSEVVYVSKIKIECFSNGLRDAHLPAEEKPVIFGVHDAIAEHYHANPDREHQHAATLDYVVAATGG